MIILFEILFYVVWFDKICFLVICWDGLDSVELCVKYFKGYFDYVEIYWICYVMVGFICEFGGEVLVGLVFLVFVDDFVDVQVLMEGDLYIICGMYEMIIYNEFFNLIGQYIGGKIWESVDVIVYWVVGGLIEDLLKGFNV